MGQFGTRIMGGKDSASARYIFTQLNPVTRTLYHEADDAVLTYLEEEGQSIEPNYYLPIIPTCLVNGAEGIGTGWSTFIPQHDPRQIVRNIRNIMQGRELEEMHPWYKGFTGKIEPIERSMGNATKYLVTGRYEIEDEDQLRILELPIGKWTRDYKTKLEKMMEDAEKKGQVFIEEIREYHEENRINFLLYVPNLQQYEREPGGIIQKFMLSTTFTATNLVLFGHDGKISRRVSTKDILHSWFELRANLYELRKAYLIARLEKEHETLRNKVRFIKAVIEGDISINRVKRKIIAATLWNQKYATMSQLNEIQRDEKKVTVVNNEEQEGSEVPAAEREEEGLAPGEVKPSEYDYLLTMPLWSLSEEKVEELIE